MCFKTWLSLLVFCFLSVKNGRAQEFKRLQTSSAIELFQFNPYSFLSAGGDLQFSVTKKWSLNYQFRLSSTGNNNFYFHTGMPQFISYACFKTAIDYKSAGWGLAGVFFAILPEGIGYKLENKKFKSQLNISMWGFEQYVQSSPSFRFTSMSQTLQYTIFINKSWRSFSTFAPYFAFTINDQVNWKTPAQTGWRLGCNFYIKKKNMDKRKTEKDSKVIEQNEFN